MFQPCTTNTVFHRGISRRIEGKIKSINRSYVFRQVSLNLTGPPKADIQFFCVAGKQGWGFSKDCRGTSCLRSWMTNLCPKISKPTQRHLPFSDTDTGTLERIGHEV